jgi:hypothetical protein
MKNFKALATETAKNCELLIGKDIDGGYKIYIDTHDFVWFETWHDVYCWLCGYETEIKK